MDEPKRFPDYSIEKLLIDKQADSKGPTINFVVQLEIESADVRCMKGDCCKDCPGNWAGG